MAGESNGRLVEPGHKGMNGYTKPPRSKPLKTQKGLSIFSIISRLLTWYSIITILFRCPSTVGNLTESSPKICKPYFQLRSVVAPHIEPYYDAYAAPYVQAVLPYYELLDQKVLTPATVLGTKYAAPRVAQAQDFGQAQWEKNLQPQVLKYQGILKEKYDQALGPHVDKAVEVVSPYYSIAKTNALQTYYEFLLPAYTTVQPYVVQGYGTATAFTVDTVIPYSQWAWTTGAVFLDRIVWPKLRMLYGENVEPQLVRIGERLGRYRDGKKLQAIVDEIQSSSSASSVSNTLSYMASSTPSVSETVPPITSQAATTVSTAEAAEYTPENEREVRENAQKVVAKDLKEWQEKFAKAADEGADELEEKITEITERLIKSQAQGVAAALVIQLEEVVKSSLENLESKIISIVKESKDNEAAEDELNAAVRKAGVAIKEKAQAVRTWRQSYDRETNSQITKAADDTFEILDYIRDLGLQEVGMRWAWTDGITHKDWAKYHKLKPKFDEWRGDVEKVLVEHPGLEKARAASEEVENQAMSIAENAAKDLARLKEAGRSKILVKDSSSDFSIGYMQKVQEKLIRLSEAAQSATESISSSASSLVENASSSVLATPVISAESFVSAAQDSVSSIVDQVSSAVIEKSQDTAESISTAIESASDLANEASSSVADQEPGVIADATDIIESAADVISSSISSLSSEPTPSLESSSESSTASKKVWGGAMAQSVEAREIIYEDVVDNSNDSSFSEILESLASQAGSRYSDITNAVSEALLPTTTPESQHITKLAADKYSSALSVASVALYGTEQGTGESISSVVSSRYAEAIAAASSVIYGTPAPITASIAAQASSAYDSALSVARDHYSHARSAVSAQISGKPKPVHEEMFSSVEAAYSDSLAAASSRLQAALSSGSSVVYGTPTPTYQSIFESISSVAQSRLSAGLSAASSQFSEAKSYVSAVQTPEPAKQKLLAQIQDQFYAGVGMVHVQYSEFVDKASSAVLPTKTQTPFTDAVSSIASENWDILISKASSQIYGTPTPYFITQRLFSEAKEYGAQATDAVASQYSVVQSIISELVIGKEPDFTESVYSRISAAYGQATSSASSYASEAYESASSVVNAVFTPPSTLEAIYGSVEAQVNSAVEAASIQFYGSSTGYMEAALSSIADASKSAQRGLSEAFYGTSTGTYESVTSVIAENLSAATSVAADQYSSASAKVSSAVYGPEKGAIESAQSRLSAAFQSAQSKLAEFGSTAGEGASSIASSVSSVASAASSRVRDEL